MAMAPYERLDAWRQAHQLALALYRITGAWPSSERYELTSQTRRAALSIPANIAEGTAKLGPRELRRFLDISMGSLAELSYYLRFARDRGLLTPQEWEELEKLRDHVGRLTWGLLRTANRRRLEGPTASESEDTDKDTKNRRSP